VKPEAQTRWTATSVCCPRCTEHPLLEARPADKAGLKAGDVVLALNGEPIVFSGQLTTEIRRHPEERVTLTVQRAGATLDIQVTPRRKGEIGLIGIFIQDPLRSIQPNLLGAAKLSLERNVQFAGLIVQTLRGLLTRDLCRAS
jgi:regulator of sigma E protease